MQSIFDRFTQVLVAWHVLWKLVCRRHKQLPGQAPPRQDSLRGRRPHGDPERQGLLFLLPPVAHPLSLPPEARKSGLASMVHLSSSITNLSDGVRYLMTCLHLRMLASSTHHSVRYGHLTLLSWSLVFLWHLAGLCAPFCLALFQSYSSWDMHL